MRLSRASSLLIVAFFASSLWRESTNVLQNISSSRSLPTTLVGVWSC